MNDPVQLGLAVALAVAVTALAAVILARAPLTRARRERDQAMHDGDALRREGERERERLRALEEQLRDAQDQVARERADKARLEERLTGQRDKLAFLEQSREQLKQEFENLSAKIFEHRSKQFEEKNRQGLDTLLNPFREQLAEFRRRVDQIHSDDTRAQAAMTEQLQHLKSLNQQMHLDARNLTQALKGQVKTQGNWGEMILERVLESSGLTKGREYDTQVALKSEDGGRRLPDAVVHLPEDKDVVVDAKVSLVAYERLVSAEDEDGRREARISICSPCAPTSRGSTSRTTATWKGAQPGLRAAVHPRGGRLHDRHGGGPGALHRGLRAQHRAGQPDHLAGHPAHHSEHLALRISEPQCPGHRQPGRPDLRPDHPAHRIPRRCGR